MTSMVATLVDPLTEPPPPSWDAFVAARRLSPLWNSTILRSANWAAQVAASMVLVEEAGGGEPVALFHARHLGASAPHRFARPGRMPALSVTECRMVPGMMDAGMAFSAAAGLPDRAEAVRVFERAIRRRTGPGGLAIAYRELGESHLSVVPTARRVRVRLSPQMVLHNEWPDLAGYLATLPPKWRSQLKKIHSGVTADPTITVTLSDTIDPAQACWLVELVRRRHHPRMAPRPPLPALYFEHLAALPGAQFLTYHDAASRMLAFTAALDTGTDVLLLHWGSRSRADGGRANLYFDQYLRLIEYTVSAGRPRLVMGKGLQEIKTRYGARPEPLWGLVGLR